MSYDDRVGRTRCVHVEIAGVQREAGMSTEPTFSLKVTNDSYSKNAQWSESLQHSELRCRATTSGSTFTSRKADTQEFYISNVTDPIIYYSIFFKGSKILHIYNRHSKIGVIDPS